MIQLTFDTDVLRDCVDPHREHHQHAKELVRLDDKKTCDIRVVSRFTADVPKGDLRDQLAKLAICQRPRIPTIAQWDVSDWDADRWASDEDEEIYKQLFQLIFPDADPNSKKKKNRVADVGHLLGHMHAKRDIFVTRDKAILKQAASLLSDFGISVMTPADAVRHCSPK